MSAADLSKQTPAEIDGQLFPILEKIDRTLHWIAGQKKAMERYGDDLSSFAARQAVETLRGYQENLDKLNEEAKPFEAEHAARQWTRYIQVSGSGGHLHVSSCHTLHPGRTLAGLVPAASGLNEVQVIETFNYTACTHCFPGAPVEEKLSPAAEGFCPRSGQNLNAEEEAQIERNRGPNWRSLYRKPSLHCECGGWPSVTGTDKIRKHKPGTPS